MGENVFPSPVPMHLCGQAWDPFTAERQLCPTGFSETGWPFFGHGWPFMRTQYRRALANGT